MPTSDQGQRSRRSGSSGSNDTNRRERLPANLIQAQRDLFRAHTYQRIDRPGSFHTDWSTGSESEHVDTATAGRLRRVA